MLCVHGQPSLARELVGRSPQGERSPRFVMVSEFFGFFRPFVIGYGDGSPAGGAGVYAATCSRPRTRQLLPWRQRPDR
jgi:hypothetical protein